MNDRKKKLCLTVLGLVVIAAFVIGILHFGRAGSAKNADPAGVEASDGRSEADLAMDKAQQAYDQYLEKQLNTPCGTSTSRAKRTDPIWKQEAPLNSP